MSEPSASTVYEIRVRRDSGWLIRDNGSTETWEGWRVKYRPMGSKGRWSMFVSADDLSNMGVPDIQRVCQLHAASVR